MRDLILRLYAVVPGVGGMYVVFIGALLFFCGLAALSEIIGFNVSEWVLGGGGHGR